MHMIALGASALMQRIDRVNRLVVGALMILLLLDVWVAVLDRYLLQWQLVWVEELARYIMIWAILMAVPCCTAHREHVGLAFLLNALPERARAATQVGISVVTVGFFAYVAWFGIAFAEKGVRQFSTVFSLPMYWAYLAIPVSFGLAALQATLVLVVDLARLVRPSSAMVLGAGETR
ncbi:MAG: TRAP transporter small permease [Rhodocyclaceae bacterium]